MIHTKRVIFMILPLLFVPLVYGLSSTPDACAVPPDPRYGNTCTTSPDYTEKTCCWREKIPGQILGKEYCQTCKRAPNTNEWTDCKPKVAQLTTPPTTGENVLPGGGLAEQPEQPPLFGGQNDAGVPPTGGIEQPPLFGWNIPQGGFEILQDSETPPMFGQSIPEEPATLAEEGEDIQPRNTTFPTPQPFPPPTPGFKAPPIATDISPDLAPEDDQDETDDEGKDIPDTGITEQPETQQPEDSSEGAETAGPLT